uniref:Cytochrome c oxidase subunit NDUFA4 n=1 Tax=Neovison vison TaxID=452646 RepID=A0A8C7BEV9_NEOVI
MICQILDQAKKHSSLILIFLCYWSSPVCLVPGIVHPDVSWDRKNNTEPWKKLGLNDQYKFYPVNVDYSKLKKEGPDF